MKRRVEGERAHSESDTSDEDDELEEVVSEKEKERQRLRASFYELGGALKSAKAKRGKRERLYRSTGDMISSVESAFESPRLKPQKFKTLHPSRQQLLAEMTVSGSKRLKAMSALKDELKQGYAETLAGSREPEGERPSEEAPFPVGGGTTPIPVPTGSDSNSFLLAFGGDDAYHEKLSGYLAEMKQLAALQAAAEMQAQTAHFRKSQLTMRIRSLEGMMVAGTTPTIGPTQSPFPIPSVPLGTAASVSSAPSSTAAKSVTELSALTTPLAISGMSPTVAMAAVPPLASAAAMAPLTTAGSGLFDAYYGMAMPIPMFMPVAMPLSVAMPPTTGLPYAAPVPVRRAYVDPLDSRSYSYPFPRRPPFCLWIGNVPSMATVADLVSFLGSFGIPTKDVRFGRRHGAHTCCYVDFLSLEHLKNCLRLLDSPSPPAFMGRLLDVDINEGLRTDRESAMSALKTSSKSKRARYNPHRQRNLHVKHVAGVPVIHSLKKDF